MRVCFPQFFKLSQLFMGRRWSLLSKVRAAEVSISDGRSQQVEVAAQLSLDVGWKRGQVGGGVLAGGGDKLTFLQFQIPIKDAEITAPATSFLLVMPEEYARKDRLAEDMQSGFVLLRRRLVIDFCFEGDERTLKVGSPPSLVGRFPIVQDINCIF
mgnify:CR=1 FL=1